MPYVPPHLRQGYNASAGGEKSVPRENSGRSGRDDRDQGDRGSSRPQSGYGNRERTSSFSREEPSERPPPSSSNTTAPVVPITWEPSERVKAMSDEMTVSIRTRLNLVVEFPEGAGPKPPPPIESFDDMNLHLNIMLDIRYHEYDKPTPIQSQAIPIALSGKDILGLAETGSGKTAAFSIPLIQHVLNQPPLKRGDGPLGLILAPTRELAQQIQKEVKAFSRSSKSVKSTIVVGGTQMNEQRAELRNGVEIVVATPGRLIDHLQQRNTDLGRISFLILDEADRMLDMGFEPQIREVMSGLPKNHQTLLFSATMPEEIESLANDFLSKPVHVKVGNIRPTANVTQHLEKTSEDKKVDKLLHLVMEEKMAATRAGVPIPLTIVFVERKARCDEVADALCQEEVSATALHGGRSQFEREEALREFRTGNISVLVATDVASRGLDVSGIAHVVNLDLPRSFEDYVHRIGRTGRAGTTGRATSFYTERDSFLVSQIKLALTELEKGNDLAFATGKAARKVEREAAIAFRESQKEQSGLNAKNSAQGISMVQTSSSFQKMSMGVPASSKVGAADDAWDD